MEVEVVGDRRRGELYVSYVSFLLFKFLSLYHFAYVGREGLFESCVLAFCSLFPLLCIVFTYWRAQRLPPRRGEVVEEVVEEVGGQAAVGEVLLLQQGLGIC